MKCARCKLEFADEAMGKLDGYLVFLAKLYFRIPGEETEGLYCPRCRSMLTACVSAMVVVAMVFIIFLAVKLLA